MKQKLDIRWRQSLAATILLIVLVFGGSFLLQRHICRQAERQSFQHLTDAAAQARQIIQQRAQIDREYLSLIAAVVSGYEDLRSPELWEILDRYTYTGMITRMELLLPDDTVLTSGGRQLDASDVLSFDEEAALGAHLSDRSVNLTGGTVYVLRHFVPVVRNGETVAMLYGLLELDQLQQELSPALSSGGAAVYIIDGCTGDFLLDTWHGDIGGNIWALGERPMADGYDAEQLRQGLIDGQPGYVVFLSETTGEHLYLYYEDLGINDWRIALSSPEDTVLADAYPVRNAMYLFLAIEAVCLLLYLLWMIRFVRREADERQRQLDALNYSYHVEQLLFNAHVTPENIQLALGEIGRILEAERVDFWMLGSPEGAVPFLWEKAGCARTAERDPARHQCARKLLSYFQAGGSEFKADRPAALREVLPEDSLRNVRNLVAISIKDSEGAVCGILAASNLPDRPSNPQYLRQAGLSFSMLCRNMASYHAVKEQGERDLLSGLYNRNRYELDLDTLLQEVQTSLACVYIDLDGLHETNNTLGHETGDRMLQAVSAQILETFGSRHAYRIGGDEFLVFTVDLEETQVYHLCRAVEEALARQRIHISVGVQWQAEVPSLDQLIRAAEQKMYAAKQAYYASGEALLRRQRRG